tara:strand:- start:104 stop:1414 length:1311 start_codon:yes stop_codon:yes gene_type:complete
MGKPLLKEDEVPSGGIADFIMSPDEIKQIEALEAREQFGGSGIANFEEVASRMASYGRFGDDTVAHLQKGEVIVPRALIEQNPKLKESIFDHLRELGIEDPERYVVGSSANSINPDTGMPEFFLGKIIKGVKNIFKKVGKVLKKAAPIIGSFLLTPFLGPVYGPMVGQGLGSLMQGKSPKEALQSALMGGVFGGIATKIGGGSLGEALKFGNIGTRSAQFMGNVEKMGGGLTGLASAYTTPSSFIQKAPNKEGGGFFDTVSGVYSKYISPSREGLPEDVGFLRKYGPLAAAGLGAAGLAGAFTAPKEEEIQYETGKQLLEKDPEKYTPDASAYALNYLDPSLFGIPNQYYSTNLQMKNPFVQSVKDGGEIFPRRTGGIDPDEGVAGKDSVRAMLMPGEFVMTTKAVKGMGNGNLDKGIDKMYDMMRNLEGRERMMA